jgi:hypothetical protein
MSDSSFSAKAGPPSVSAATRATDVAMDANIRPRFWTTGVSLDDDPRAMDNPTCCATRGFVWAGKNPEVVDMAKAATKPETLTDFTILLLFGCLCAAEMTRM